MADPLTMYGWLLTLTVAVGLHAEAHSTGPVARVVTWLTGTFIGQVWDGLLNVTKAAMRFAAGRHS